MAAAMAPLPLADALAAGLVEPVRRRAARRASTWSRTGTGGCVADVPARRRPGVPLPADHVLGVGGASTTLAGATVRRPVGTRARPRHRLRRPGAAPVHPRRRGDRHRLSARGRCASPRPPPRSTGMSWELLRRRPDGAGGRAAVRPRGQQPAVRGRPGRRHAHLPRLRPGRRRGLRRAGRRRARACSPRAAPCSSWPTGCTSPGEEWARPGRRLVRRDRAGRLGDPARGRRPGGVRRPVAGRRRRRARTPAGRRPGWTGSTRRRSRAVGFGLVTLRRGGHDDPIVRVEDLRQRGDGAAGRPGGRLVRPAGLAARTRHDGCSPPATGSPTACSCARRPRMGAEGWAVDRQVLALPQRPALDRGDRPAGAGAGRAAATARVPLRDQLAVLAVGARGGRGGAGRGRRPDRGAPGRARRRAGAGGRLSRDAGGGADGQPGERDGRRRGGRRDRRRAAGAARGDPLRHRRRPPRRWPARCTSCASWTTSGRPSDVGAPVLVVSQFTLYGDARKGRRPTWSAAAPAEVAEPLVTAFVEALRGPGRQGGDRPVPGAHAGGERQRRPANGAARALIQPRSWGGERRSGLTTS